jgi:phosphosulfolactate phosphohydrolase-like enzyme
MNVTTRNSYEPSPFGTETEVAIFCDIFRASTTLLTLANSKAKEIYLTNDEETAFNFVKKGALLFSEVFKGGYDNSPTQVMTLDLVGKTVIHKSTNLTNAVFHHPGFARGYIGGFVNLSRVVSLLKLSLGKKVELVAASHFADGAEALEDVSCIKLMASYLNTGILGPIPMHKDILALVEAKRAKGKHSSQYFKDIEHALTLDDFNFLAEVTICDEKIMRLTRLD